MRCTRGRASSGDTEPCEHDQRAASFDAPGSTGEKIEVRETRSPRRRRQIDVRKALVETVGTLLLLAAALLLPARDLGWPEAWAFLLVMAAFSAIALASVERDLVEERSRLLAQGDAVDVVLSIAFALLLYPGTLVVCGLDHRHGWSARVPALVEATALCLFIAGYVFALWAMRANRFFSTVVRIQTDRGHRLIDDGPYRFVRHPGYAGAMLAHLALPIALGSLWGLVPAAAGCALLALRVLNEEALLLRELDGYRAYTSSTRWRLVPGVW